MAAGTTLAVSLTGCLGDTGTLKATGDGTHGAAVTASPSGAQQAIALVSQKSDQIATFRAKASIASSYAGRRTRMSGTAAYLLGPQPAYEWDLPHVVSGGKSLGHVREIVIGDTLYMNIPAMSKSIGARPWVKVSLGQLAAGSASGAESRGMSDQSQQADPRVTVRMLTASTDARRVGTDVIGGARTTHYRGTYSMRQALAKLTGDQRAQAERYLGQTGLDTMSFDLWVDGRQLPRKVRMASRPGARLQMVTTTVYTAFNTGVSIASPPARQVTDASDPGHSANTPA